MTSDWHIPLQRGHRMPDPIAGIVTCHNRKAKTLACLESVLRLPEIATGVILYHVFLCDDGSTDGTSEMVKNLLGSRVTIIPGNGQLFWNRGMVQALRKVVTASFDALLLLNDDVVLKPDALQRLADAARAAQGRPVVLSGATMDATLSVTTYGGFLRGPWWNRLRMHRVAPGPQPIPIDTCNCNILWIPRPIATAMPILDPIFVHAMGDIDFGLRLRKAGIPLLLCAGHLGTCDGNPPVSRTEGRWARLKRRISAKECPFIPWITLCWRHAGCLWPVVSLTPYIKALYSSR